MPQANVIRWREGAGWLILSGGDEASADAAEIDAEALARVAPGDPLAYIWAASDVESADKRLDALRDLGAPTGYLVDVLTEDDATLRQELSEAGLIVIGDGPKGEELRSGLLGAALDAMAEAYERGAVVLAVGQGATVMGSIFQQKAGIGWVEGAIIVPAYELEIAQTHLRDLLTQNPGSYGLGIGNGSALALGPEGAVATWGKRQITVSLGKQFPVGKSQR